MGADWSSQTTNAWAGVGITSSVIVGLGITYLIFTNGSSILDPIKPVIFGLGFAITSFLPFGLFLFGFISDIINQEYRNSYISLMTLVVLTLSGLSGRVLARARGLVLNPSSTVSSETGWCTLPGLESIESPYIPMTFLSTSIIMTFYSYFAGITLQRPYIYIVFMGILIAQLLSFYVSGCWKSYSNIVKDQSWVNIVVTIIMGIVIGLIIAATTSRAYQPFYSDWNINEVYKEGFTSMLGPHAQPPIQGKNDAPTCSQPQQGDENTFVAELYKNGQLVTDKIA